MRQESNGPGKFKLVLGVDTDADGRHPYRCQLDASRSGLAVGAAAELVADMWGPCGSHVDLA